MELLQSHSFWDILIKYFNHKKSTIQIYFGSLYDEPFYFKYFQLLNIEFRPFPNLIIFQILLFYLYLRII